MCRYIHAPLQTYKKERGGKENDGEGCKHFNFACELEEINLCAGDVLFKNISTMTKKSILIVMLYVHYLISALPQPCQGSLRMLLGDEILILFMEMW